MKEASPQSQGERRDRLLHALESLLALPAAELRPTLNKASQVISELLHADKVDVFLLEMSTQTLVAVGTSDTPMGRKQKALGLDRLPLAIGGETRSVLGVSSAQVDFFGPDDLRFLMPLRARIELIQRRATRDKAPDYLRDADGAAASLKALSRLISDLLDVSRLDQGLFTLRPQPVDVVALAKEVGASLRGPGHEVQYRGPQELVIIADPDRLRQALENLAANAMKHSPPGLPVGLDVQEQVREEGRWVRLAVSDQGPGIPPDMLDTLFERFARGPGSTGLGLGLYLARQIATAHGGTLEVTSRPGDGTRFEIALPEAPPNVDG